MGNPIGFHAGMEILTEGDEREAARVEHFYTEANDCFDPDEYFGQDDPSVSPMAAGLSRAHSSEFEKRQTVRLLLFIVFIIINVSIGVGNDGPRRPAHERASSAVHA